MGYTTDFKGVLNLSRKLTPEESAYLKAFARSRRMRRDSFVAKSFSDPVRKAVGLPIGKDGGYYVGSANKCWGQDQDASILDYNEPPGSQPGLWCQWIPSDDDCGIIWNNAIKFYDYLKWLKYIQVHFLKKWGVDFDSGSMVWQGERQDDYGVIYIEDGKIISHKGD